MIIILFNQNFPNKYSHYYQTSDLVHYGIKIQNLQPNCFILIILITGNIIYQRKQNITWKIKNIIQFKIKENQFLLIILFKYIYNYQIP